MPIVCFNIQPHILTLAVADGSPDADGIDPYMRAGNVILATSKSECAGAIGYQQSPGWNPLTGLGPAAPAARHGRADLPVGAVPPAFLQETHRAPKVRNVVLLPDEIQVKPCAPHEDRVTIGGKNVGQMTCRGNASVPLLLLDFELPDGNAFDVLARIRAAGPSPVLIAMSGAAGAEESFALAQRGVRAYLEKPVNLATLERVVDRALATPPDLDPHLRSTVGHRPVREVEEMVRQTMVEEALERSAGSRRGAARLLSISRQLLQHIIKRFSD